MSGRSRARADGTPRERVRFHFSEVEDNLTEEEVEDIRSRFSALSPMTPASKDFPAWLTRG